MEQRSHEEALLAKRLTRIAPEMSELVEALDLDACAGEDQIFELADEFGRAAFEGFLARFDTPQPSVMIDGDEYYWIGREQMVWDVETLLRKRPDLELIALSDGAPEICSILSARWNRPASSSSRCG